MPVPVQRALSLLALAALLGPAAGCLFDPRDPAVPDSGEAINYLTQSEAAFALANLETAIDNNHVPGYEDALSESFVYVPNSDVRSQYPGVDWEGWDYAQEIAFINALFSGGSTFEAELRDEDIRVEDPSGDTGEWEVIYLVTETGPGGSEIRYRGRAYFTFVSEANFWYVSGWEDIEGAADPQSGATLPTMGGLRGAFASN